MTPAMTMLADLIARDQVILIRCRCAPTLYQQEPSHLAARHGAGLTLDGLRDRLRCEACGRRGEVTLEVRDSWNPSMRSIQGPPVAMGGVAPADREALQERDHARRRGRRNWIGKALQARLASGTGQEPD